MKGISTHSLTRRLTNIIQTVAAPSAISTHSLTRRLTKLAENITELVEFQLTASQGG